MVQIHIWLSLNFLLDAVSLNASFQLPDSLWYPELMENSKNRLGRVKIRVQDHSEGTQAQPQPRMH